MKATFCYILLLMLFNKIVCCEVTRLLKSCVDLQERGVLNNGYHVVFDNTSKPFIIYCWNEDGMTSASEFVTASAPRNCYELQQHGMDVDGPSIIYPYSSNPETPLLVYCDQTTDQGGWTVIQRRMDGREDFYRGWSDYENGFGIVDTEFWLGNIAIHELTEQTVNELRVDLEDWEGVQRYAHYKLFHLDDNIFDGYRYHYYTLSIALYSGTAGDSLSYHNGKYYSTFDNYHADYTGGNCAEDYHGAWWYSSCAISNLNGRYYDHGEVGSVDGVQWSDFNGLFYSHKRVSMKIRPFQNHDTTEIYSDADF